MTERGLRGLIESVRKGTLTRREFVGTLLGLGIAAPIAGQLLMHAGIAQAQAASSYKPTKRGGGGALKMLWWQGPTLLNPHFADGHQGPGRFAHFLRTARGLGQRGQSHSGTRRGNSRH